VVDRARPGGLASGSGGGRLRGRGTTDVEVVDVQVHLGADRHLDRVEGDGGATVMARPVALSSRHGNEPGHLSLGQGTGVDECRSEMVR
jgi:hypothetical protein